MTLICPFNVYFGLKSIPPTQHLSLFLISPDPKIRVLHSLSTAKSKPVRLRWSASTAVRHSWKRRFPEWAEARAENRPLRASPMHRSHRRRRRKTRLEKLLKRPLWLLRLEQSRHRTRPRRLSKIRLLIKSFTVVSFIIINLIKGILL